MMHSCLHPARPLAVLAGALFLLPARQAGAQQQEEGLQLYGGIGWGHDDNLLRVPDNRPAFQGKRSDRWRQLDAGVVYNKRISRQRVALVAKASKVQFDHFRQLDYDGRDLQATWFWEVGNKFDGQAGALVDKTLAPYTDFFSDERNVRERRRQWFDAGWKMHPSWKLRSSFTRERYEYELLSQRFNNRTEKASELELLYTPKSRSSVGLVARRVKGDYPFRRPATAGVLVDDFTQDELKVRVNWDAKGATTLQVLAGYVRREQPSYGEGSTSGFNGRLNATYQPRGKISYNASLWREFAPIESTIVSYTLNRGASLGASWVASGKLKVDAQAAYEQRAFNPRASFNGAGGLGDSLRSASLRATWQARPKLQVSAGWQHQSRSGSEALGLGKFDANTMMVNANVLF
ncbi:XrtB/PEP-CTERM-associated polysaccharide biosynthesis outer membrane protein EpsL [Massilia yuzhufengensis]|uniref:Exopolysaccharide biosynthesis operon protein EpsL n=1 Tax=Massilia yuzhufengensis TaxID=1164594 RepID=A0A1I1PG31_9BURK|nr:XrtB/PEP-CTERM-associated polysaccharide biosynthesis outer membrane protein EpsL [Massilia yuzhufengensis]SFD05993.1 exopolysaccharide biosynthesis operon protein EpsL [Massilia yuzhufengensis]